jgi:23S rRNA pseudouridine1911/1915/1917 synthase
MKRIGHPLVGERVYAFRKDFKLKFRRCALHAAKLEFDHPVTGVRMSFTAPLAADMEEFTRHASCVMRRA